MEKEIIAVTQVIENKNLNKDGNTGGNKFLAFRIYFKD